MKPRNIFLVRHGLSEGNVDRELYLTVPDHLIALTDDGRRQAREAGRKIAGILDKEAKGGESGGMRFVCSTHQRTEETLDALLDGMREGSGAGSPGDNPVVRYDPRLREQEWGNANGPTIDAIEAERDRVGSFHYRFVSGESGGDVYMRVSDFFTSMWREFERDNFPANLILVGHGFLNRVFLMRFFHLRPSQFEMLANPKNGEFFQLTQLEDGHYRMSEMPRLKEECTEDMAKKIRQAMRVR